MNANKSWVVYKMIFTATELEKSSSVALTGLRKDYLSAGRESGYIFSRSDKNQQLHHLYSRIYHALKTFRNNLWPLNTAQQYNPLRGFIN